MTFDLGGHKIEISRARLNYCGVHRFHASFMARHGQDAASKGIGLICESIMSDEAIRSMRRNVDEIGHVFGMSTVLPFRVYTELYFEDAVGYLESIGCHCYQKDECVKMFAPDRKEYMQGVAELLDKGLLKGLLDDTAGLIDTLDTQLQMMDSGFASDAEIAERQEEVLDSFRSKLRTLIGKFFGRRNVSDAFGNVFDKMFDLLRLNLCKAATLAGDRFACEPTSEDELEMACKVCESLKGNDVEESKVVPVCLGVLQIAPHLAAAYPPLYIRVGDKSGDLSRMAELAGVKDMDVLKECILPRLYSHTRIRELSNIDAFRKDLHEKWAFYALDDKPEEWSFYVAVKRSAEMVRSTFHRRRLSSPELADHYRAVYKLLCDSDFATSQESAEGARNAVVALARKLDVPTDWLESILEEKTRLLQIRLYDDLKEYLCSLDLSTEEKAIAARDAVRCEALRIGYKAFCNFPPLEALISRYDCKARSVLGREFPTREEASAHRRIFERIVSTDFQSSSECCKLALNECVKMASEDGIDADWLISDLHTALRRHDEESRVRMGYLYATHEEADAAYKEPELVFRAVWSAVKRFA